MNETTFFAAVKQSPFSGKLAASQIDGMQFLLAYQAQHYPNMPVEELAYVLATVKHETAHTMRPIVEKGGREYFLQMYDMTGPHKSRAAVLGNSKPGDGPLFCGRGYVQITGRNNYRKFGIEATPADALKPEIAARILFDGMIFGKFTGLSLSDCIKPGVPDFLGARRIINGRDCDALISGYAKAFLRALNASIAPAIAQDAPPKLDPENQTQDTPVIDEAPPAPTGTPEQQATGKPMTQSTTAGAATVGGIAGTVATAKIAIDTTNDIAESGKTFVENLTSLGPWVLLAIVIISCAAWIIRERYLKSKHEGV